MTVSMEMSQNRMNKEFSVPISALTILGQPNSYTIEMHGYTSISFTFYRTNKMHVICCNNMWVIV